MIKDYKHRKFSMLNIAKSLVVAIINISRIQTNLAIISTAKTELTGTRVCIC